MGEALAFGRRQLGVQVSGGAQYESERPENSESDLPKMKRQNAYRYRLLPLQKTNKERALVSQAMVEKDVMLQPVSADHESSRLTKMDDEILQPRSVATTQFL